jgi:hypothetical protein
MGGMLGMAGRIVFMSSFEFAGLRLRINDTDDRCKVRGFARPLTYILQRPPALRAT